MDDLVWLTHPDTGGINRFAAGALEAWTARGWVPCEPPGEDESHLRDPAPPPAADPGLERDLDPQTDTQQAGTEPTPASAPSPRVRRGITSQE